jgi:capsular exopolysaccharide synthesis family protein
MSTMTTRAPELRDYLTTLWVRRWWVILTTVLVTAIAFTMSVTQTKLYSSFSEVLVKAVSVPGDTSPTFVLIENEIRIAGSAEVAEIAAEEIVAAGFEPAGISVDNPTGTEILTFQATSPSPRTAQITAAAHAEAYLTFRRESLLSSVDAAKEQVDRLIATLQTDQIRAGEDLEAASEAGDAAGITAATTEIQAISNQIAVQNSFLIELERARGTRVGEILEPGFLPTVPSSPNPQRSGALGLFIGLSLGIGLAFLRDRLDQRVGSREDIESTLEAPLLGRIPVADDLHEVLAVGADGNPLAGEAFRALRTRLQFAASQSPFKSVMITSSEAGEGKTTTAANLAVALAQTDSRVVLVGADLRRPELRRYFPDAHGPGLADVLSGASDLSEVVRSTPLENLLIIPSGRHVRDVPEASLGSQAMAVVLQRLGANADVVVLDAPPLLGVSDSLDLASLVDVAVMVVDAGRAHRSAVAEATNDLRSVGAGLLGVVLTRYDPSRYQPYYKSRRYGGYADTTRRQRSRWSRGTDMNGHRDDRREPSPSDAQRRDAGAGVGPGDGRRR